MSIFPFIDPQVAAPPVAAELPMAKEWAWDFEKGDFLLKDGKFQIVKGKEAVKIWLWKIFQTPRYRYLIYSWGYGHELEGLVGKMYTPGLMQAEAERLVKEAIWPTLDGYVTDIRNLTIGFTDDVLSIEFTAVTPYGEVEVSV